jgi:hypothetical protein
VTIGNFDDTFAKELLFSPFTYQVFMFILCYYILSVLPMNIKNMTIPICDKENGTFVTSINQYIQTVQPLNYIICALP